MHVCFQATQERDCILISSVNIWLLFNNNPCITFITFQKCACTQITLRVILLLIMVKIHALYISLLFILSNRHVAVWCSCTRPRFSIVVKAKSMSLYFNSWLVTSASCLVNSLYHELGDCIFGAEYKFSKKNNVWK